MTTQSIPLTVIGGYLGAGKTTLLNHILRHNDGRRLAVIVNDFGSINIDAELIESQDGDTINLANGCICCSLTDGFVGALINLLDLSAPPDHVIVEASGVADPAKLGQYGHYPGFRLDGVIVLADAEQVRKKAADKYVGDTVIRQIKGADLLLLNKVDLVNAAQLTVVRDWLSRLAPGTSLVETTHGQLPLTLLLGLEHQHPEPAGPEFAGQVGDHEHDHREEYQTWSFIWPQPLCADSVRAFLDGLPGGVLRAKGLLYLRSDPERRSILQLVGNRSMITAGEPWGKQQPETKLVFIGLPGSIDEERFKAALIKPD